MRALLETMLYNVSPFRSLAKCRNGKSLPALDQSFRDFMEGKLPALPGEHGAMKDWELHLGFMYPEERSLHAGPAQA